MAIFHEQLHQNGLSFLIGVSIQRTLPSGETLSVPNLIALLDTGATNTVLGQGIVNRLELIPDRWTTSGTPNNANAHMCLFDNINIIFPNDTKIFHNRTVSCTGRPFHTGGLMHLIIGMDILRQGTFLVNGLTNSFILEFPER